MGIFNQNTNNSSTPSASPSNTPYWTMAGLVAMLALGVRFLDANGILASVFPTLAAVSWYPSFIAAFPSAAIFIGLVMGWLAVTVNRNAWFSPLAWLIVFGGYWAYAIMSGAALPYATMILSNLPIPSEYMASAASMAIWALYAIITAFAAALIAYHRFAFISAGMIVAIVIVILVTMYADGFLTWAANAVFAPLPPEVAGAAQGIVDRAVPAAQQETLQGVQSFLASDMGVAFHLLITLALYWLSAAIALKGLVVR